MVNAGDGTHEHPTQALLDALTIRRAKGRIARLIVAICGDILHSRVARSNIILLNALGARVRVVAPSTLLPAGIEQMGVEVCRTMAEGLKDADVVMMLRLQRERMSGAFVPSVREYFRYFGLDAEKLKAAKADALVMHPGPMNRGVEIASEIADGPQSVIQEQVEMGVAVRMAVMEALLDPRRNARRPRRMSTTRLQRRPHRRPVARHRRGRHASSSTAAIVAAGKAALEPGRAGRRRRSSTAPARRCCPAWSTRASSSASRAASIARPSPRPALPRRPAASPRSS